jgi:hypothetical protein
VTKSRTTVTVVLTAGPGDAPFVAGENRPVARVSVWEEILEQREKNWGEGSSWGLYTVPGGSLVTTPSEEKLPAPRRKEARRRAVHHARKKMRTTSPSFF